MAKEWVGPALQDACGGGRRDGARPLFPERRERGLLAVPWFVLNGGGVEHKFQRNLSRERQRVLLRPKVRLLNTS